MVPAGTLMVPSVLIETPVRPPSAVILILSSIRASVAGVVPFASSFVKTVAVVPPKEASIGVAVKSSATASIVGGGNKQYLIGPKVIPLDLFAAGFDFHEAASLSISIRLKTTFLKPVVFSIVSCPPSLPAAP